MENVETPDDGHEGWLDNGGPADGQRGALHRLAAAIRRVNGLIVESDMSEAELLAAAAQAEEIAEQLANGPRGRSQWTYAGRSPGDAGSRFSTGSRHDDGPMIGLGNAISPPMRLRVEGDGTLVGLVTFGDQYEGPPNSVYGGFVAAAFDEVLGTVQSLDGMSGLTANLQVNYRSPTPLHRELTFHARVDRVDGRKKFTSATLTVDGRQCADATGLFVIMKPGMAEQMRGQADAK